MYFTPSNTNTTVNMNRMLSRDFMLSEFTESKTAKKHKIDNTPSEKAIENLTYLAQKLLQPLRDSVASPLKINSGYRSTTLNRAVGGEVTSQHLKGEAADVAYSNPRKLLRILLDSGLDYDQAIVYPTFLHLSLKREGANRKIVVYK